MKRKRMVGKIVYHILVSIGAFIMVYPLLWMVMSSFKETNTIFTTAGQLIPKEFTLENYRNGWKGFGKVNFGTFFKNFVPDIGFSNSRHHTVLCFCGV